MHALCKILTAAILLFVITVTYISCQKDLTGITTPEDPQVNDVEKIISSVQGYVTKEDGTALAGAIVTAGTSTATTDAKGYFRFNGIQLSKNNGYVQVSKAGYFNGSRSFVSTANRVQYVTIQMIPQLASGNFQAAAGGVLTLPTGLTITFPSNSIVLSGTSTAYTGQVNVSATWLDPTSSDIYKKMPGDLRGITTGGAERVLETYGMMAAELKGASGEALAIAAGKTASIKFPLPAALATTAPASIPLWHFDEVAGRWKEEGSATKTGNTYVAEVKHFSYWNCDAPFPLVNFSATVVNSANAPLAHAMVRIKKVSGGYPAYGYTDSSGYTSGKIPANEALVLEVLDRCNAVIFSQNIGPFTSNTNLGTITAANSTIAILTISGTVTDCSNNPLTNGYVELLMNGGYQRALVSNGAYQLTITNCSTNSSLNITAVDNSTNQQSAPLIIPIAGNTVTVPAIQACGVSSAQNINYTISATAFSMTSPADSITSFSNGTTTGTTVTAFSSPNQYSVTFQFNATVASTNAPLKIFRIHDLDSTITVNPTVNITEYGPLGGFIQGSFNVQMYRRSNGTTHPVTCTFRVRRR